MGVTPNEGTLPIPQFSDPLAHNCDCLKLDSRFQFEPGNQNYGISPGCMISIPKLGGDIDDYATDGSNWWRCRARHIRSRARAPLEIRDLASHGWSYRSARCAVAVVGYGAGNLVQHYSRNTDNYILSRDQLFDLHNSRAFVEGEHPSA